MNVRSHPPGDQRDFQGSLIFLLEPENEIFCGWRRFTEKEYQDGGMIKSQGLASLKEQYMFKERM